MFRLKSVLLQIMFLLTAPLHNKLVTHKTKTVHDIDYSALKNSGVTLLIFDLDDTLTHWRETIPKEISKLFTQIQKDMSFSIAIFSNTTKKRINRIKKGIDKNIIILEAPSKPLLHGFKKLLEQHNITPNKAAMIGDRLATDMWGAKRAGIATRILVEPYSKYMIGKRSPLIQKFIRTLEKVLNGHYFR